MSRAILSVFTNYQKARTTFTQTIAELAQKQANIDILYEANVLELLRPLLNDVCPTIRQCAAVALGRLVENNPQGAPASLTGNILPNLLEELNSPNKYIKKSVLCVLRSMCKNDAATANTIVRANGLTSLIYAMGDFEPMVKESALCAVGYIAKHNKELAQAVIDAGAIPSIVLCLQEPEINMKQVAASVLADISKHSMQLAQHVADCGAIPHLAKGINSPDVKLKRVALNTLSNIAKHSLEMAETIVECNTFPTTLVHLAHSDSQVRRSAAMLVRDVVKHSLSMTQMVVNLGGIGAIMECMESPRCTTEEKIPSFVAIGYMAGQNDQIGLSIINCRGVELLNKALDSTDDVLVAVAVWALGQVGKHSPEHAKALASLEIFPKLLAIYNNSASSVDLQEKAKNTLKQVLQKCMVVSALEPLIEDAPPTMLKYILGQYTRILPNDPKARRMFVTSGALKKIQEMDAEPGSSLMEHITMINACFPEEIVRYYSPGYSDQLLDMVEQYAPEAMSNILRDAKMSGAEVQTRSGYVLDESTSSASQDIAAAMSL